MSKLIDEMRRDSSMETILARRGGAQKNVGLVNQFKKHKRIPNKWFDWERCVDAQIMIIGQDWGPYEVLSRMISDFDQTRLDDEEYYHDFLFRDFSSRTERFILKAVQDTYLEHFGERFPRSLWDEIFFTMAVLFTRQGKHFRGSEFFHEKKSAQVSYRYVSAQIDIVKPAVIVPLGNLAFEVLNQKFNLGYKEIKITKIIESLGDDGGNRNRQLCHSP